MQDLALLYTSPRLQDQCTLYKRYKSPTHRSKLKPLTPPMPELIIPESDATVRVRMIDTSGVMVVNAKPFIEPVQKGHELVSLPVAAFLIDHPPSGRKIMFDLGVRKDYWKLPAALQKRLGFVIPALRVDKDTTEILQEKGISLDRICKSIRSNFRHANILTLHL